MKVLVIDDDDVARELVVSVLEEGGHEALGLPSPIGATQAIIDERIEAVVLDLFMPALSGDKLAKMLRSNPRLKGLVIVLISSCDMQELQTLARSVKADAVLAKADIRRRLCSVLGSVKRRNAS
jgi:CheY-like chemotaxis protein